MVTFIALWHLEDYSPWSAGEVSSSLETFLEHKKEKNKNENIVKAFWRSDDDDIQYSKSLYFHDLISYIKTQI